MKQSKQPVFVGIGECKGGWIACVLPPHDDSPSYLATHSLSEIFVALPKKLFCCIDIPTILESGPGPRGCDERARQVLGAKNSTVYFAPSKAALQGKSFKEASRLNREETGVALTKQSWSVIPKIRETVELLSKKPVLSEVVLESNPELVVLGLTGEVPRYTKKSSRGRKERLALLHAFGIELALEKEVRRVKTKKVAPGSDDILDATLLALGALLLHKARGGAKAPRWTANSPGRIHFPIVEE